MGKINIRRVFLGGIAAGVSSVVLQSFALVLGVRVSASLMRVPDVSFPAQLTMILAEVVIAGPAAVWLYAAIRPRFGAGPGTAIIAALWIWLISGPYVQTVFIGLGILRLVSLSELALLDIFGFFSVAVTVLIGAWLYKEEGTGVAKAATG